MKYLKLYEAFVQKDDNLLIVESGTELFHGTSEKFDINNIRGGGYDSVFWTADNSAIAQTYISECGLSTYVSTKSIAYPSTSEMIRVVQKELGIIYDYSDIEFNQNMPISYKPADIYKAFYNDYFKIKDELNILYKKLEELKKDYQNDKQNIDKREEIYSLGLEIKDKEKLYYGNYLEKQINQFVNSKLEQFGYKPQAIDTYHFDNQWKLKLSTDKLEKSDFKCEGRLLIIKPKRDLKIYDVTLGGTREADLTDEDYHKISWFRQAEEKGYDGIKITDHAQSIDQGNIGHYSIGLFKNVLKDLEVVSIPAVHQELEEYFGTKWETPEYKNYKNSQ